MDLEKYLEKFRPRGAVRVLAKPQRNEAAFLHTWALARLLAWAIADQPGPKKRAKEARDPAGEPKRRRKIRTANAKLAGQITLANLLNRHVSRGRNGSEKYKEKLQLMLALFMGCGGFASCFKGWGAQSLLHEVKDANRRLGYVYRIVDFMCRYRQRSEVPENDPKFTIEGAKSFVEMCAHEDDASYGLSKISKIWERYRKAAPYIFAVYRYFSFRLDRAESIDEIIDWLEKFASDQERLTRVLGRAAYASDILTGKGRNVRQSDFRNIERLAPPMRPFSEEELAIIDSIDHDAPVA
jgi:hypothetical protein